MLCSVKKRQSRMSGHYSFRQRRRAGTAMAETAAAITILVPIAFVLIYAVWEGCFYLFIVNALAECSREAARGCAIAYGAPASGAVGTADSQGPNVAPAQPSAVYTAPILYTVQGTSGSAGASPPKSPNQAFGGIRAGDIVTDNSQFVAVYSPPAPNNQDTSYTLGRVCVTVTYKGPFPRPDPLGLGSLLSNFKVQQAYTYTLEF
jgi:hypothetical protein